MLFMRLDVIYVEWRYSKMENGYNFLNNCVGSAHSTALTKTFGTINHAPDNKVIV